jgi:PKD repeat protein
MFIFPGYASIDATADLSSLLRDMGAIEESGAWKYRISAQNKDVEIRIGNSIEEMNQALMTEDAHVLYFGHSNYGLGALFATPSEFSSQVVDDILFIDDDRIFNYSSEWVHVNIRGMRTGQAYPFWWPIFKDGSSGIMPYDFGDPLGDPVFNYYVTYQVPGDPTHYKIENVRNGAIERFPDWGGPAWYSPNGSKPNSSNPEDQQYFITNPEPWEPSVEVIGGWQESQTFPGYYLENYIYAPAGRGDVQVRWMFDIPAAGYYKVQAWWSSSTGRSTNAPYTIYHSNPSTLADNNTTIRVNQRLNGARWNELGEFFFDVGEYFVMLTDDTTTGTVVGDAIRVEHVDNPSEVLSADFNARVRSGVAPLEVTFESTVIGQVSGLHWDFGDGATNNTRDYISHVYDQPGIYSVSFTVSGPLGTDRVTKAGYIVVAAGSEPEPILRAEFSARSSREGVAPFEASFRDRSSGNIISWLWDFGDGHSSEEQNPVHLYEADGIYTVKLTVTDANGSATSTETKPEFIRVNIYDKTVDNVDYPKTHYRSKTLLFVNNLDIDPADLKYSRLLYVGCDSGHYFTDTFKRGKMFYALNTSSTGDLPILVYLRSYLEGKTDHEIWQDLQNLDPIFDYFDFDRPPTAQPVNVILSSSEPRAFAVEPMQADVNYTLDEEKEKTIQDLGDLSISMAFDRLGSVDILSDEKFLDKAIYYAFQHRQKASVAFALNAMKQDLYQPSQSGGAINRGIDFYVAEQIFKMFPDEAIDPLLKLYQNGDPITRANVVRASGVIANHPSIYQLLITALDDEDFFEEVEGVESIGNPMRVCDHAYNQIVLKYQIKSVLRTISSAHRVERRDNHIEILKKVLPEHNRQ